MADVSVTIKANQVFDVGPVSAVDRLGNPVALPDAVAFSVSGGLELVSSADVNATVGASDQSAAGSGSLSVSCGSLPAFVIDVTIEAVVLGADHLVVPVGDPRDR